MGVKADPFMDKRFSQPGQKTVGQKRAQSRKDNRNHRAKKKIGPAEAELNAVKADIGRAKGNLTQVKNRTQELADALAAAPTPAAQRKIVLGMICESGVNPMAELLAMVKIKTGKNALPPDKRRDLLIKLLEYQAPKPKSIDIQADVNSSLTIQVVNFEDTSQGQLKAASDQSTVEPDEHYNEFLSPEQLALQAKKAAMDMVIDAAVEEEED
jgi:hypothetical protein